jgi:DNA-binding transcriptional regulator GbsR (MarR family)
MTGSRGDAAMTGEPVPQRDEEAVRRFVERFAAGLVEAGVPVMPARVFSTLLTTDSGRMTAADLAARLDASPAAISGAVRYLALVGMISRERMPGSRRAVYAVLSDVWYEVSIRQDQAMTRWGAAAREGVEVLDPATPAGRRMAETLDFILFIQREIAEIMTRWRAYQAAQSKPAQT